MFLENITTILPQSYDEVPKNVSFNVICVYFRQVFINNLSIKFVWFSGQWNVPTTIGLVFGNIAKNIFSMSLGKNDLTLQLRSLLI